MPTEYAQELTKSQPDLAMKCNDAKADEKKCGDSKTNDHKCGEGKCEDAKAIDAKGEKNVATANVATVKQKIKNAVKESAENK